MLAITNNQKDTESYIISMTLLLERIYPGPTPKVFLRNQAPPVGVIGQHFLSVNYSFASPFSPFPLERIMMVVKSFGLVKAKGKDLKGTPGSFQKQVNVVSLDSVRHK